MHESQATARILLVDDHPLLREGLAMRLSMQSGLEICGEAASEEEGLARVKELEPDLMVVDIALKSGNGIELIKQVKSRFPKVKMLVVSCYDESLYAERALHAGALGYLNKQETNEKVVDAVRSVLAGERFVSEKIMQRLVSQALGDEQGAGDPVEQLSDRELEIFRLIGQGKSTRAIADELFLSSHTIDTHRENIKRKLNIAGASELNRLAIQWLIENS